MWASGASRNKLKASHAFSNPCPMRTIRVRRDGIIRALSKVIRAGVFHRGLIDASTNVVLDATGILPDPAFYSAIAEPTVTMS
jgi:hypothetical protein